MAWSVHLKGQPPETMKRAGRQEGRRRRTMKNVASCVALFVVVALCSIGAQAQVNQMLKADIPFDFTINETHLPAGTYWIQTGGHMQYIRAPRNSDSMFLATNPVIDLNAPLNKYVLKFNRYGDEYFLTEIWAGGSGSEVPRTAREKQLAKARGSDLTFVAMQVGK
jgi:hypothetical protein